MAGGEIQQSTEKGTTETVMAMETATLTARITTSMPMQTTVHQLQQQGRHARDVPCYGGSGGNVSGGGGVLTRVEEVATTAAEEADNGRCRQRLCSIFFLGLIFFSPSPPLPWKAEATVWSLATRHILGVLSPLLS
jgi:hypothetical protein